jgi:hypothetical protein
MTPPLATRLRLIALVIAAWWLPLIRAIRRLDYVIREDTGSIHAANDIRFAQSLVVSYGFSLAVAVAVAWLMPGRRTNAGSRPSSPESNAQE